MPQTEPDYEELTKTLIENFSVLADEVQWLSDQKTILEHKLRFAHEQYQHLADKYAPSDPEILSTIAKLQLPPDSRSTSDRTGFVPLPQRQRTRSKQQTAVAIRDGRRASQRLGAITNPSTESSRSTSRTSSNVRLSARRTSLSTVLEHDFTIPGKKGSLSCPFASMAKNANRTNDIKRSEAGSKYSHSKDHLTHDPADPICVALYAETMASPPGSVTASATKCPIRYLDQHTPEEVAQYFETHKHEIPRSHEVCVKRYQRNEEDIRKLDAKYGNLVSMIQGLGQKHQAMLPTKEEDEETLQSDRNSNERVEKWANGVSVSGTENEEAIVDDEEDRSSRFDRPLKEIRVGESPSRPWGISVPVFEQPTEQRPVSPPPAPVQTNIAPPSVKPSGQCPFDHGALQAKKEEAAEESIQSIHPTTFPQKPKTPKDTCPKGPAVSKTEEFTPRKDFTPRNDKGPGVHPQPAFIQPSDFAREGNGQVPQMIFTGPVFIGYPFDQAMAFARQHMGQG